MGSGGGGGGGAGVRVDLQLPGWVTGRETGLPWQRMGRGGRGVWMAVGPEAGIWKPELRADTQSL